MCFPLNKSIFTGNITRKQMKRLHPMEMEEKPEAETAALSGPSGHEMAEDYERMGK